MFIKEIRIKNFRSILKAEIPLNNISIFVGLNDVGKSNVLRALNLFFNGYTDYANAFNLTHDFCQYSVVPKKKAPEVIIELVINAPKNYKESKDIVWKKIWRRSGFFDEEIIFHDGSAFPKKSKLYSWLQNLRYNYIPAIRGNSYFEILLGQLHDSLVETVESDIRGAGDQFIRKIESNTGEMIKEISNRLGIKSKIRFPSSLQNLFKTLEFSTSQGASEISLTNRGDGIKTRHIPVILKFIAEQLNVNKIKGSPNVNIVWGYEEPENNLEMRASFSLAQDFLDYSSDLQILVTTHSPSFYSLKLKQPEEVNLFKVLKDNQSATDISPIEDDKELNIDMGILPIVAPYIDGKILEIEELASQVAKYKTELKKIHNNTIFVEGDDEIKVFEKIIEHNGLKNEIAVRKDGLGCSGVRNQIMAWSWASSVSQYKAIGLFDNDESGNREFKKLDSEEQFKVAQSNKKVKAIVYKVPDHLKNIKSNISKFPIEIEEMYSPKVWAKALENGWLEEREHSELNSWVRLDNLNQTLTQKIESFGFNEEELLFVRYKIPDKHKDKVSKYCCSDKHFKSEDKLIPLSDFFTKQMQQFLVH